LFLVSYLNNQPLLKGETMSNLLRSISFSELKATPGKFRAVAMIDSDTYQIGEDVGSFDDARALCRNEKEGTPVQVYDENGIPQIQH
jgi:hypothetical protein